MLTGSMFALRQYGPASRDSRCWTWLRRTGGRDMTYSSGGSQALITPKFRATGVSSLWVQPSARQMPRPACSCGRRTIGECWHQPLYPFVKLEGPGDQGGVIGGEEGAAGHVDEARGGAVRAAGHVCVCVWVRNLRALVSCYPRGFKLVSTASHVGRRHVWSEGRSRNQASGGVLGLSGRPRVWCYGVGRFVGGVLSWRGEVRVSQLVCQPVLA